MPAIDERAERGFFEVVLAQRAQRDLLPDPVPDEVVERLLLAATHAPSAENLQPWVFVVVRDPALRARIGELAAALWRAGARGHAQRRLSPRLFADVDRWASGGLAVAPVIVVACGDGAVAEPRSLAASVFPAVQNLCLAAAALGLGSVLTTLPTFDGGLARLLELPPSIEPMAVVPIGWPRRPLGPPRRAPVAAKAHRDRFGHPW